MFRRSLCSILALGALSACGTTPAASTPPPRGFEQPTNLLPAVASPAPGTVPVAGAPGGSDPRVQTALAAVQKLRDTSSGTDSTLMLHYVAADGTKSWIRSHYKYQKPLHNAVELVTGSDTKVEGTQLIWTGGGKVKVKTKFVGFWLNINLDLSDDRLKDPLGYRIDQTSINKLFDTVLCPQNQVSYLADGNVKGRPMAVLNVISPLSLKPVTREVIGIEKTTGAPILREMYKGDQLIYRMELESSRLNPKLTSTDFELQ